MVGFILILNYGIRNNKTETEYQRLVKSAMLIFDSEPNTVLGEELKILIEKIKYYEFTISLGDQLSYI